MAGRHRSPRKRQARLQALTPAVKALGLLGAQVLPAKKNPCGASPVSTVVAQPASRTMASGTGSHVCANTAFRTLLGERGGRTR